MYHPTDIDPVPGFRESVAGPGDLAEVLQAQARRIDELTRSHAALLDEHRAYRQRALRETERVLVAEKARIAQVVLGALDDLELILASSPSPAGGGPPALVDLREGVRQTAGALEQRIGELGATRMEVIGQRFDPHLAEAVATVAVSRADQAGLVIDECRSGWRLGDRVLRPARVRVGRLTPA